MRIPYQLDRCFPDLNLIKISPFLCHSLFFHLLVANKINFSYICKISPFATHQYITLQYIEIEYWYWNMFISPDNFGYNITPSSQATQNKIDVEQIPRFDKLRFLNQEYSRGSLRKAYQWYQQQLTRIIFGRGEVSSKYRQGIIKKSKCGHLKENNSKWSWLLWIDTWFVF